MFRVRFSGGCGGSFDLVRLAGGSGEDGGLGVGGLGHGDGGVGFAGDLDEDRLPPLFLGIFSTAVDSHSITYVTPPLPPSLFAIVPSR